MMKEKKWIWAAMALILICITFASDLLVTTTDVTGNLTILHLGVIQNNPYYDNYYNNPATEMPGYKFSFFDINGSFLYRTPAQFSSYTLINYSKIGNSSELVLTKDDIVISRTNISFCDSDDICDACMVDDCTTFENELNCGDCRTNSEDGYCNFKDDNVCDPDCISGYDYGEPINNFECYEDIIHKNQCNYYNAIECGSGQECQSGEFTLESNGKTCCDGPCVNVTSAEEYTNISLEPEQDNLLEKYSIPLAGIGIIVFIILVIVFFRKSKIITFSLFGILIITGGLVLYGGHTKNNVTGNVASQAEIVSEICAVAKQYGIPGNILVGIAAFENDNAVPAWFRHWCNDKVCVSFDGGVGLFQITRNVPDGDDSVPPDPQPHWVECGLGSWTQRLNAKDLTDNIKCGALILKEKYAYFPQGKRYYCDNKGTSLPDKDVFYTGWEAAIRGYNGWGCTFGGATDAARLRVQSYVEEVLKRAEYYKNSCQDSSYTPPETPENTPPPVTVKLPDEILNNDKTGYYYLNPSFRAEMYFDAKEYDLIVADAKKLVSDCRSPGCKANACWTIKKCHVDSGFTCDIDVDTRYRTYVFDEAANKYEEKPIIVSFALELGNQPIQSLDKCEPIEIKTETIVDSDTECSASETLEGIDISHWQGTIDWGTVKKAGKVFAFIKATEGTGYHDDTLEINANGATAAGIYVGAYHFARPDINPDNAAGEARYFARYINPLIQGGKLNLHPVLDLEAGDSLGPKKLTDWVIEFMNTLKAETGVEPILYTNPNYINNLLDTRVSGYDLWIANYGVPAPTIERKWDFWQYSESGTVAGINDVNVDLDIYKGNAKCLTDKFGIN